MIANMDVAGVVYSFSALFSEDAVNIGRHNENSAEQAVLPYRNAGFFVSKDTGQPVEPAFTADMD